MSDPIENTARASGNSHDPFNGKVLNHIRSGIAYNMSNIGLSCIKDS